jgi:hypothetical protein
MVEPAFAFLSFFVLANTSTILCIGHIAAPLTENSNVLTFAACSATIAATVF